MNGHEYITDFRIQNFKRFGDLSVSDLGRINLVVGDNNVGKTSLLEAFLADEDLMILLKRLHKTLCFRSIHIHARAQPSAQGVSVEVPRTNYLGLILSDLTRPLVIETKTQANEHKRCSLESTTLGRLTAQPGGHELAKKYPGWSPDTEIVRFTNGQGTSTMPLFVDDLTALHGFHVPFVPASRMFVGDELLRGYETVLSLSRAARESFLQNLSVLVPGAQEVLPRKIHETEHLAVVLEGSDESHPLTWFGDGTVKCARIFMEMQVCKNGRLMVDEIDAGIHYRRMDDFWRAIVQASLDNNVQLIAATHSLECLQSLRRVFATGGLAKFQGEVRCIALSELADGKTVKAYTYPWGEFLAAIEHGNDLR